jgi:hypothetical protein
LAGSLGWVWAFRVARFLFFTPSLVEDSLTGLASCPLGDLACGFPPSQL